jgi:hypothetical protein
MPLGSPPIQPSAPPPVYCAACGCEVDAHAWICANCGASLHVPDALTSKSSWISGTLTAPRHAHSKGRAVFRFFLYLGCFAMFVALTWGQDSPRDDPKTSLVFHAFFIFMTLIAIGEVVAKHSYSSLTTRISERDQSLGEETFGIVLIALFMSLYIGLKWHLLPPAIYTGHLEGSIQVVFWAILLVILWAGGIFDRR